MSTPLRVLHAHSGNVYGGVETLLVSMARNRSLAPDLDCRFALTSTGRLSEELTALGAAPLIVGTVRASRPWTVSAARTQMALLLARHSADMVLTHSLWSLAAFGPVARRAGLPLALWMHGPATGPPWLNGWARRTPPDLLLANSRYTLSLVPPWLSGVPATVVYPPVDVSGDVADEAAVPPTGGPVIMLASRLDPGKGHALLLDALAKLRTNAAWSCWIAGGPQHPAEQAYLESLQTRARALGVDRRVTFLGQRRDIRGLLRQTAVHCQPNTSPESFGIAFVEALAAGVPVVTTRLGAAPEIVTEACGMLVPSANPVMLAAALDTLLDDPGRRAALGGAGPARAVQLCDPRTQLTMLAQALGAARAGGVISS